MKKSASIKILEAMESGVELTNIKLNNIAGWRFGGIIFNLKKYGCIFSKRKGKDYIEYWKLESIPSNLIWKGRNKILIIKKKNWFKRLFNL